MVLRPIQKFVLTESKKFILRETPKKNNNPTIMRFSHGFSLVIYRRQDSAKSLPGKHMTEQNHQLRPVLPSLFLKAKPGVKRVDVVVPNARA